MIVNGTVSDKVNDIKKTYYDKALKKRGKKVVMGTKIPPN